jgi:hypothetical protein
VGWAYCPWHVILYHIRQEGTFFVDKSAWETSVILRLSVIQHILLSGPFQQNQCESRHHHNRPRPQLSHPKLDQNVLPTNIIIKCFIYFN